jgi:phytoene dehydrogenase-like protein
MLLRSTALWTRSKAQAGKLLARLPKIDAKQLADQSVRQWLDSWDLRPDAAAVVLAMIRLSTYVADVDEFAADAAIHQLQIAARPGVLYLDGGWGSLVEALCERVEVLTHHRVVSVEATGDYVDVRVRTGGLEELHLRAGAVVVASGSPNTAAAVLGGGASPSQWGELGPAVTGACLDVASRQIPKPGLILGVDDPVYGTTQGPPARLAPEGQAVVSVIRYGARSAAEDRPQLESIRRELGVHDEDVVFERFLARMVVAEAMPRAAVGGMQGRPKVTATGLPSVYIAGDWVGPDGLLADASLASGYAAARLVLKNLGRGQHPMAAA